MKKVTVFTPTYNRAHLLGKLYKSMLSQTNKSFVWLIVDDGSTDETRNVVESFKSENKIEIDYIYQKNAGKHVAHNTGVLACETDIFYCVDSDDYLSDDCIEIIIKNWNKVEKDDLLAGIIALKEDFTKNKVITKMPKDINRASIYKLYYKYGFKGDAAIVFKTKILKNYLFPVFKDEKFVTEGAVYDLISKNYEMLLLNQVIYYYEYLDDGYSANIRKVHLKSPKGYIFFLKQRIKIAISKEEYKNAICEYITGMIMIRRNPFKNKPVPFFGMLKSLPCSFIRLIKIFIKSIVFKKIN